MVIFVRLFGAAEREDASVGNFRGPGVFKAYLKFDLQPYFST